MTHAGIDVTAEPVRDLPRDRHPGPADRPVTLGPPARATLRRLVATAGR
ncbi:hypothetical protein ACIRRH_22105 [Kitasatospora sp. NPDC101235]